MKKTLQDLEKYLDKEKQLNQVITLLYWDMRTAAPKKGFAGHAEALTHFSTQQFELSKSPELEEILTDLSEPEVLEGLSDKWQFVVKRMKRDMDKRKRVPTELFERYVRAQAESERAWEEAKNTSDFSIFAPHLKNMVDMTKEIASYTDPGKDVYDALLDQYEEGVDRETIDRLFSELKQELVPLVRKVLAAEQPDDSIFQGYYDINAQKKVQELLLKYIGFDFEAGAAGESEHPFTLNFSSQDVRVTNHYYEHGCINAMFSAIHEGGHGIFEQNVNPDFDGTVAGSCSYMGIHESQSRFYENILGRNKNFWIPIYSQVQELLPKLKEISLDAFYKEINHVRNSLIRIEADELTYCFHIILRYEMERSIFIDNVPVEELPELWNKKMQEYLQITPSNDGEGILQDMHWSDGSFGYFPSYLLGSIYDGMYLETIREELGDPDELLAQGRIQEITRWLNEKIHQYGSTRLPREVLEKVCKKEVSAQPLIRYFKEKYQEVYRLEN
ncbi:MAG: carboxypeptidase M32 [Eubacteriales bacterium]|nr:carboxypeptidase M32 [Eubacteriales bacterium]